MDIVNQEFSTRLKRPPNLSAEIAAILREEIQKGTFPSDETLPSEAELGKKFDVSRTVVREAIARLKSDGLIDTRQGKGAVVVSKHRRTSFRLESEDISEEDFLQLEEFRIIVEADAAAIAALQRTDGNLKKLRANLEGMREAISKKEDASDYDLDFHMSIAEASGNQYMREFIPFLNGKLKEIIAFSRNRAIAIQGMTESVQVEHEAIFEAIARGDPDAAKSAMKRHIKTTCEGLGLRIHKFLER